MVSKFGLGLAKHRRTPIGTYEKIAKDEVGNSVDQTLYKSMIGSMLYLITSRPDLCYSMGVYARYQASPKDSHLQAIKKIIKYVSKITYYGLWYTRGTTINLVGNYDADWVGNSKDHKSTYGGCFILETTLRLGSKENKTTYRFPQLRQGT